MGNYSSRDVTQVGNNAAPGGIPQKVDHNGQGVSKPNVEADQQRQNIKVVFVKLKIMITRIIYLPCESLLK